MPVRGHGLAERTCGGRGPASPPLCQAAEWPPAALNRAALGPPGVTRVAAPARSPRPHTGWRGHTKDAARLRDRTKACGGSHPVQVEQPTTPRTPRASRSRSGHQNDSSDREDGRVAAQPERYEDQHEAELLAGVLGHGGGGTVTLSGRCPQCTYLYGSPGHKTTCAGIDLIRQAGRRAWDINHGTGER